MSSNRRNLIRSIRRYILIVLLSLLLVLSVVSIFDRVVSVSRTRERIRNEIIDRKSQLIKSEILLVSSIIHNYITNYHDKNEILDYLQTIHFENEQDHYIFINTYKGDALLLNAKRVRDGKNIWNFEDPNGVKVIQEERKAAEKPNGGFIHYSWVKPTTGVITPKISFVIGIPELKWMVGTGVYLDSIESETVKQVKVIYKDLITQLILLVILLSVTSIFLYLKFKRFTTEASGDISIINKCLENVDNDSVFCEISRIKYDEFFAIGHRTNEMIEKKRKAEEAQKNSDLRFRLQKEQSPLAYVGWDLNNQITDWNPSAERIFGYSREEALGRGIGFTIPETAVDGVTKVFQNLLENDGSIKYINQNITKDGRKIICEWYNSSLRDNSGKKLGIVAVGLDITKRVEAEEEIKIKNIELEKAVKEKTVLLKEVHHRVKNNMAIISSLLSLQANEIEDKQMLDILQSSQSRIQSMALVHEHIYKNETLSEVNVEKYITELVEYIISIYTVSSSQVSLNIDVAEINFELNTLIPLGMLINEMVSNSLKYAFDGAEVLKLTIILKTVDNTYYLNISDNGPGFDFKKGSVKEGSIGLMLIKSLVEQLEGRLKVNSEGRTSYEIYF